MYVIHAQFHTISLKVYEQIILNLGRVPGYAMLIYIYLLLRVLPGF